MDKIPSSFTYLHKKKTILGLVVLVISLLMYVLNCMYPLLGEDWDYSFVWGDNLEPIRLRSISDIISSQYVHYRIWGGRVIVHGIDQLLLYLGPSWHNIINTLAYTLFVYTIYRIVNFNKGANSLIYLFIVFVLWFFVPDFHSLTLWITYSAVYLWSSLIVLLFIYPYYSYLKSPKATSYTNALKIFIFFLFGIIAGWTNENISITLLSFIILTIISLKYTKRGIPLWSISGLIGVFIGCAFLILAPGNFSRLASTNSIDLFHRVLFLGYMYLRYILLFFIIYAILLYMSLKNTNWKKQISILLPSFIFFFSAHIGIFVMLGSPISPARTLFGPLSFLIIAIGILINNLPEKIQSNLIYRRIMLFTFSLLFILFCIDYVNKYNYVSYLNHFWENRAIKVQKCKDEGILNIAFSDTLIVERGFIVFDFKNYPEGWPNTSYSKYQEIESVITY